MVPWKSLSFIVCFSAVRQLGPRDTGYWCACYKPYREAVNVTWPYTSLRAKSASIAASGDRKRPIQLDDDEFVVIRLTGCAAGAEGIIVIV